MEQCKLIFSFPSSGVFREKYETESETRYDRDGEHAGQKTSSRYIGKEVVVERWLNIEATVVKKWGDRYSPTRYKAIIHTFFMSDSPKGVISEIRLPIIGADEIISTYKKILPDPLTSEWEGDFENLSNPSPIKTDFQWRK